MPAPLDCPEVEPWQALLNDELLGPARCSGDPTAAPADRPLAGILERRHEGTAADRTGRPAGARAGIVGRFPRGRRAALLVFLAAAGMGLIALQLPGAAGEPLKQMKEQYYDFRGHPVPADLTPFGVEDGRFVRAEPEGLRITVPRTWIHSFGGAGFRTKFGSGGDFEITATLEVLHADIPPAGYGVGAILRVGKIPPSPEGATFCRLVRAGGKQILLWDRSMGEPGEKLRIREGTVPRTDTVGRLRLRRMGTILHYLWAPGTEGEEFQEIHQCDFGADEVKAIRFGVVTGRKPCDVDVRFLALRVRAESLPGLAVAPAAAPASPKGKGWLAAVVVLGLLTVLALLGVWLLVRRGRRAAKPAGGAVGASAITFPCPGCGKPFTVKAEWAGKKGKCTGCGTETIIPADVIP